MVSIRQFGAAFVLCLLMTLSYTPSVQAALSNSTNYGVSEVQFGSGGELRACSSSYCSKQSAGELTVGNTGSANYQAQAGFNTDRNVFLEVTAAGSPINLGDLDSITTAKGSTTFSVKTYLAYGYNVIIEGSGLKHAGTGQALANMTTTDISRPGTEQFGINLRQNTTPLVGGDVTHSPDSSFGFGAAAPGYDTVDNFRFNPGETIAQSPKSSGTTNYTISAIANVDTTARAGVYKGRMVVIVVPTF
ncbi:MAG TPA: hypothetical protein VK983_01220 [Candidatus Limnocylindrales bacterium]|nr:hypothetical protein [Candidatus Limnocylindrales bacterium]